MESLSSPMARGPLKSVQVNKAVLKVNLHMVLSLTQYQYKLLKDVTKPQPALQRNVSSKEGNCPIQRKESYKEVCQWNIITVKCEKQEIEECMTVSEKDADELILEPEQSMSWELVAKANTFLAFVVEKPSTIAELTTTAISLENSRAVLK